MNAKNLYLIWQDENGDYDTYDSAVVCAETEEEARNIHPGLSPENAKYNWVEDTSKVHVILIGKASDRNRGSGVICASFNAG